MTAPTKTARTQSRSSVLRDQLRAHSGRAGSTTAAAARLPQAASDEGAGAEGGTVTRAELWLYGVVGGYWWGFSSDSVAHALRSLGDDIDEITVRLDSPGGSATQGLSIANLLANHNARVRVVVDGLAASAASQIALAGDEVVMSPGAQLMLHDAWMFAIGNAADLRSDAEFLDKQSRNYAETYAHRAGGTAEEWRTVMLADNGRGTWYTAAEAVQAGLADRVANIASTTAPPPEPEPDEDDEEVAARAALDLDALPPSVRSAWTDHLSARARSHQPPSASAVGNPNPEGGAMSFINDVRTKLGVAEDADEATTLAALDEALEERAEDTGSTGNMTGSTAASLPDGMVAVEAAVLDDLRAGAAAGREARDQLAAQTRDAAIDAAIRDGRTTPARRDHWTASWNADPEGTRDMLAALQPGLVPLTELGHGDEPETTEDLDVQDEELAAFAAQLGLKKEDLRG